MTDEKNLKTSNNINNTRIRIESIFSSYIKNITDTEQYYISRAVEKELIRLVNDKLDKTNEKAKLLSNTNYQSSVKNYRPLVSHVDTDV